MIDGSKPQKDIEDYSKKSGNQCGLSSEKNTNMQPMHQPQKLTFIPLAATTCKTPTVRSFLIKVVRIPDFPQKLCLKAAPHLSVAVPPQTAICLIPDPVAAVVIIF